MGDKSAFVGGMKLKISELGKVITGNTPSKKIKEFWDKDDVGFVKPDIISDEHIVKIKSEDCNEFISNAAISKARIVPKNSIFVTCIGNIGKIGVATENLAFNQQINAIIPNENVNLDYLCYAIFANKTRLQDIANAPIVPLLNKSQFSEFELEFDMDINTQTRIVHELNTVSNIILKYKQELLLLDELVRARFMEMFGDPVLNEKLWRVIKLGELCSKICSGNTPKGGSDNYTKEGIMFFRSQNVWKNRLELDDIVYIDEATHEKMKETSLNYGDILITKTGRINTENSSLGRSALFLGKNDSANINGHVYLVRINSELVNRHFVLQILISPQYRDLIRRVCVGGIDKRQLNQNHIYDFPIIIPPLELQNQFASFVEEIDKSRSRIQKSLEASQELFDSLMQEYFG